MTTGTSKSVVVTLHAVCQLGRSGMKVAAQISGCTEENITYIIRNYFKIYFNRRFEPYK